MENKDIILKRIQNAKFLQEFKRRQIVILSDGHYLTCEEELEWKIRKQSKISIDIPIYLVFTFDFITQSEIRHFTALSEDKIFISRQTIVSSSKPDNYQTEILWSSIKDIEITEVEIKNLPSELKEPIGMWENKTTIPILKVMLHNGNIVMLHSVFFGQFSENELLRDVKSFLLDIAYTIQNGERIGEEEPKATNTEERISTNKRLFKF